MHLFWKSFFISLSACMCVSVHLFCKYMSFGSLFSYMCVSVHLFCTSVFMYTWKQTYKTVIYECKCSEYQREVLLFCRSVFISVHPIQFGVSSKRLKMEDWGWRFRLKIEIEIAIEIGCWDWRLRLADTHVRGVRGQSVYTDCHVRGGSCDDPLTRESVWHELQLDLTRVKVSLQHTDCHVRGESCDDPLTRESVWHELQLDSTRVRVSLQHTDCHVRGESCERGTYVRGESVFVYASVFWLCNTMQHTATHCNTMQHALQHTSTCGVERAYNIC